MISINIQGSSTKFALQVEPNATLESVKNKIIEQSSEDNKPSIGQLRLIYSGQILKNEKTISEYNIKDGHTLHLVKRAASSAATNNQSGATQVIQNVPTQQGIMPPLSAFTGDMNAQHILQQTSPAVPNNMGMSRQMDPNQLRMGMQMLRENPGLLHSMIQNGPLAGLGMDEEVLQRLMEPGHIEEFLQAFTDPVSGNVVMPDITPDMVNPGMIRQAAEQHSTQMSNEPPEVKFANQLATLNEMGFWDPEENIRALQLTGGNVNAAIERLLSKPQ